MPKRKGFIEISNEDIYKEIRTIKEELMISINHRMDRIEGKLKLNSWMSVTALSMCVLILGFMLQHISK